MVNRARSVPHTSVSVAQWTITIADLCAGDPEGYCERVEAWARTVYEALSKSGNYR